MGRSRETQRPIVAQDEAVHPCVVGVGEAHDLDLVRHEPATPRAGADALALARPAGASGKANEEHRHRDDEHRAGEHHLVVSSFAVSPALCLEKLVYESVARDARAYRNCVVLRMNRAAYLQAVIPTKGIVPDALKICFFLRTTHNYPPLRVKVTLL